MKIKKLITALTACSALVFSSAAAITVNAEPSLPTKAFICGEIGTSSVWTADSATIGSTVPDISGDAQYMAEWKVAGDGGATELNFLALSIPNLTSDNYPDLNVNVTAIYIDGVAVPNYKMSANALNTAYYEAGRDPETRVYFYDGLKGTNVADLPKLTTIKDSIRVIFTVSGTGQYGASNIASNVIETQATTENSSSATTESDIYTTTMPSTVTGEGDGIVAIAAAGMVITVGAAVLSKVKFKKKK